MATNVTVDTSAPASSWSSSSGATSPTTPPSSARGAIAAKEVLDAMLKKSLVVNDWFDKASKTTYLERQLHLLKLSEKSEYKMTAEELEKEFEGFLKDADKTDRNYTLAGKGSIHMLKRFADKDGKIDVNEAGIALSLIQNNSSINEKMKVAFRLADLDHDGKISRKELSLFLHCLFDGCYVAIEHVAHSTELFQNTDKLQAQLPHIRYVLRLEKIPQMVDAAFKHADADKSAGITLDEWMKFTTEGTEFKDAWGAVTQIF